MQKIRTISPLVTIGLVPALLHLMIATTGCSVTMDEPDVDGAGATLESEDARSFELLVANPNGGPDRRIFAELDEEGNARLALAGNRYHLPAADLQQLTDRLASGEAVRGFGAAAEVEDDQFVVSDTQTDFSVDATELPAGTPLPGEGDVSENALGPAVIIAILVAIIVVAAIVAATTIVLSCSATCASVIEMCLLAGCQTADCSSSASGEGSGGAGGEEAEGADPGDYIIGGGVAGLCEYHCSGCNQ